MNNNFAENLKRIRKENNLSQEQLAEELGVSRQAISKWESKVAYPEMDKIIALCEKFNLNIDDLLHKDIKELKGEEESKTKLNKSIDDFLKFITDTINLFSNMNFKSKIKCLFEQIVIIALLVLLSSLIVLLGDSLIASLFSFLPIKFTNFLYSFFDSVFILFCIISSLIIFVHIFKTRYLDYYNKLKKEPLTPDIENDKTIDTKNKILFHNNENKIIIRDPKHSEYRFINSLFKFIIGIIKLFILVFCLFLCFTFVVLLCLSILSFLVFKTGLLFIGIIGIILSLSIINLILIVSLLNFIFNRQNNKKMLIRVFILSITSLGIFSGLFLIDTFNFEVINNELNETKSITYKMNDNLLFLNNDIEYIEKDIPDIEINVQTCSICEVHASEIFSNGIDIYANVTNYSKLVKAYLEKINKKQILSSFDIIGSIKVYASNENITKLKQNKDKYYSELEIYQKQIRDFEDRIVELEDDLYECEAKNELDY